MINTSHNNYYHLCRALLFFLFLLNIANIHCYLYHHQNYHLHQSYQHHKYYYMTNNNIRRSNVMIPTVIPSPPSLHHHPHRQVNTRLHLKTECDIDPSQMFGFNDEDLVWEALRRDAVEG
jgi:hypothetical protein